MGLPVTDLPINCGVVTPPLSFLDPGMEIHAVRVEVLPPGVELGILVGEGRVLPVLAQGQLIVLDPPSIENALKVQVTTAVPGATARLLVFHRADITAKYGSMVTAQDGGIAALGATTDSAALGNGSLIGISKQMRTLLTTIAAALAATLTVTLTGALPSGKNHLGRVTLDSVTPTLSTVLHVTLDTQQNPANGSQGPFRFQISRAYSRQPAYNTVVTTTTTTGQTIAREACPAVQAGCYFVSWTCDGDLTTLAATGTVLGTCWLGKQANGTFTRYVGVRLVAPTGEGADRVAMTFPYPWVNFNGDTIGCYTDPATTTSITWSCSWTIITQ